MTLHVTHVPLFPRQFPAFYVRWRLVVECCSFLSLRALKESCFTTTLHSELAVECVHVVRRPDNPYDINCIDVRLVRVCNLLGHIEAPMAARLSPVMRDVAVVVSG